MAREVVTDGVHMRVACTLQPWHELIDGSFHLRWKVAGDRIQPLVGARSDLALAFRLQIRQVLTASKACAQPTIRNARRLALETPRSSQNLNPSKKREVSPRQRRRKRGCKCLCAARM
eukprot:249869-Prymnesium_polylepis.1